MAPQDFGGRGWGLYLFTSSLVLGGDFAYGKSGALCIAITIDRGYTLFSLDLLSC
jgi:hypothetical protein